jgi:hypothetical protein
MRRPVIFLFLSFSFGIALGYHLDPAPVHFLIAAAVLRAIAAAYPVSRLRETAGLPAFFYWPHCWDAFAFIWRNTARTS